MESSRENSSSKSLQSGSNKNILSFSIPNLNPPLISSQKSDESEQFLLEGFNDNKYNGLANEIAHFQSDLVCVTNPQKSQMNYKEAYLVKIPESKGALTTKLQNIKLKFAQFEKNSQDQIRKTEIAQQKISKEVSNKQIQRNRKTLSRLSSQFFSKNNVSKQSNIKSKVKSRRTTMNLFGPELAIKNQQNLKKSNNNMINSQNKEIHMVSYQKVEKMEIEENNQIFKEQKQFKYEKEKKNLIEKQLSDQFMNQDQNLDRNEVQNRLIQVKRQRSRLSAGRQSLINFMKSIDEEEKKKELRINSHKRKVTIDMNQFLKLINQNYDDEKSTQKPQNSMLKEMGQNIDFKNKTSSDTMIRKQAPLIQFQRPAFQQKSIIFEDQKQDQFTPMKSFISHQKGHNFKDQFLYSSKAQKNHISQAKSINYQNQLNFDLQREVFKTFFENLKQKIADKLKVVEDLKKEKEEIIKKNNKALNTFKLKSRNLQQIKQQSYSIKQKILQLKEKINPCDYLEYSNVIRQFQLQFGIKLHNYQKLVKGSGRICVVEGYFVEFTYENILFRIRRKQREEAFAIKFQPYTTMKNEDLYNFRFEYQLRTQLYHLYITKKLEKKSKFLQFMVNFIAYCRALNHFELTMQLYIHLYNIENLRLIENTQQIEFQCCLNVNYLFIWRVNLLQLRQNGGIRIRDGMGRNLSIPQDLVEWKQNQNKIANCFDFLQQYCAGLWQKELDQQMEQISNTIR